MKSLSLISSLFAACSASAAIVFSVETDHSDALYRCSEPARFTVTAKDDAGAPLAAPAPRDFLSFWLAVQDKLNAEVPLDLGHGVRGEFYNFANAWIVKDEADYASDLDATMTDFDAEV